MSSNTDKAPEKPKPGSLIQSGLAESAMLISWADSLKKTVDKPQEEEYTPNEQLNNSSTDAEEER